ncbi:hypothetical protein F5Y16DRAFT_420361 [Xylariaceae sp. FL0255]|nr:hypothetical protein F5Y16DRAFT_420361 [Xylariaceae sp. FL0255]
MGEDAASNAPDQEVAISTSSTPTLPAFHVGFFQINLSPANPAQIPKIGKQRKGPLSPDCERRWIRCQPAHHNMPWEVAVEKYQLSSQHQNSAFNQSGDPTTTQTKPSTCPTSQSTIVDPKSLSTKPSPSQRLSLPPLTAVFPLSSKPCYSPLEVTTTPPSDSDDSSQIFPPVSVRSKFNSNGKRRTGPLSAHKRLKTAMMRKVGACSNCRMYRHPHVLERGHGQVSATHAKPSNQTQAIRWSDHCPDQAFNLSPPQDMEIYSTPTPWTAERHTTRLNAPGQVARPCLPSLVNAVPLEVNVQSRALEDLYSTSRNQYTDVHVLLIQWGDEPDKMTGSVQELADLFERDYHYMTAVVKMTSAMAANADTLASWILSVRKFFDQDDSRDTLKIIYDDGLSDLDHHSPQNFQEPNAVL